MRQKVLLVVATFLAPTPLLAGWGGAEWGMSRDDVALVRNEPPVAQDGEFDRYMGSVGVFAVGFAYKFGAAGLEGITIYPIDSAECSQFENAIRETYGEPFLKTAGRYVAAEKWRDEATGNLVDLFEFEIDGKISCHVMYEPLKQPNSGGF